MAIKTNLNKYVREPCYTISIPRPVETKKKNTGGLPIMYYCRSPWLADEENFPFQIVWNG